MFICIFSHLKSLIFWFFILQTFVNDVPLDGAFVETVYGVIIVVPQVLKVHRNRCSKPITLQVNVRMPEWMNGWMGTLIDDWID